MEYKEKEESTKEIQERCLVILEISQKQAYIFSSNKLKDNILHSAQIAYATSPEYFRSATKGTNAYTEENHVYTGGGHTVLEFQRREEAVRFNQLLTSRVHEDFPGMEMFVTIIPYDAEKSPGENMLLLTKRLEIKKAKRYAAFHQGSFGIERINSISLEPEPWYEPEEEKRQNTIPETEGKWDRLLTPEGYETPSTFEKLGVSKGLSSFIAIVHIDGNAMGKRVANFYAAHDKDPWSQFKKAIRVFSDDIDADFKAAFAEMNQMLANQLQLGTLKDLALQEGCFPLRRIISSGDDICFVAEGRIGIEAAVSFLNALVKKGYAACAGVALVHQKYPFFKAYELAEALCGNAKKFGAELGQRLGMEDGGSSISAIDWHIEQGEIKDTLEEIRDGYIALDGSRLELRPLLVHAPAEVKKAEPYRQYQPVKKLLKYIQQSGADSIRGKLKELRAYLKQGEHAAEYYIHFQRLESITLDAYQGIFEEISWDKIATGQGLERRLYLDTADGVRRSILFDAVEVMDTYIPFAGEGGTESGN